MYAKLYINQNMMREERMTIYSRHRRNSWEYTSKVGTQQTADISQNAPKVNITINNTGLITQTSPANQTINEVNVRNNSDREGANIRESESNTEETRN